MTGGNNSAGVAIVGIACRFPGAADHSAFWRNLCEGVESISELSDQDLLSAGVPGELLRNPSYVKAASLLPDIDQFDAAFFDQSSGDPIKKHSNDQCNRHQRHARCLGNLFDDVLLGHV